MFDEEEKTITLRKPVTLGSGDGAITYTELKLREPLGLELEKASRADTNFGQMITLISLIAKVPRAAAERLCQRDLQEANDYLQGFSERGQPAETAGQS
ncbi:phage tail assembly protein [Dyella lutea]|uniref:Phage tail assembly protein n=1 Tax=Dyella lutea TaxID=2950441 RepID=A0ABT1FFB4_9GAMM|nr:phage tail assembly protein [Dyella lutea]MCP1376047.1 phage tail assembly protein [Dyella lutea]